MGTISLEALLAVLIEREGGAIEITQQDVEDTVFDERVIVITTSQENTMVLTLQQKEDVNEYFESKATD